MLRYKTKSRPGLVALYDIRPGNGEGPFLQPRSPHGALRYRGRGKKWLENVNTGMTISPGGLPYYYYYCMHRCSNERDRASWHCTIGGSCLSSPTSTNLCEWKSGFRLASNDTCDASSMTQTSNVRRANSAELLTPRQVVATTS